MIQIKRCINLKKLIDAFDIKENQITALSDDFETFKNKALLNELRNDDLEIDLYLSFSLNTFLSSKIF